MTNRVFKHYHRNKPILDFITLNYKILCVIMLEAHKLYPKTFYPKAIEEYFAGRADYCKKSNDYEKNDILSYKLEQACESLEIDHEMCAAIARKMSAADGKVYNLDLIKVLAHNIELVFIQLNYDYGLGKERRDRLVKELLSDNAITGEPIERIEKLGVKVDKDDLSQIDYRKLKIKPDKITLEDQRAAAQSLAWLRAYQESIHNGGTGNG